MKRLAVTFAFILATAALGGSWVLVRGQLHESSCSRYRAAIRVAVADPDSTDPIVGLSDDDLNEVREAKGVPEDLAVIAIRGDPRSISYPLFNSQGSTARSRERVVELCVPD